MADKYNEVKLALTVAKTGLTKSIKKLEERGKEMGNLEADLAMSCIHQHEFFMFQLTIANWD